MSKSNRSMKDSYELREQPYDGELLRKSKLYAKSRQVYLTQKGSFIARLLSSRRSLGSATLIENVIEYSPLATEVEWSITNRLQKKDPQHFDEIRGLITNVFHEQNHRNLWAHFKKMNLYCPQTSREAYCFLNFVESLVIALDMALADELDLKKSRMLNDMGVFYRTGSDVMKKLKPGSRGYRDALQVALHATYFRLSGLHPDDIGPEVRKIYSSLKPQVVDSAIHRALMIDARFVELTNPLWQKKHMRKVMAAFKPPQGKKAIFLDFRNPQNHLTTHLISEVWLENFGL